MQRLKDESRNPCDLYEDVVEEELFILAHTGSGAMTRLSRTQRSVLHVIKDGVAKRVVVESSVVMPLYAFGAVLSHDLPR